jgi:hypothetical protein
MRYRGAVDLLVQSSAPFFKLSMMNEKALHLYEQLQNDLLLCKKKQLDGLKEIECCFHISESYWALLRYEVTHYEFASVTEEIRFFKEIKPKFVSESDYYSLLYHAELFRTETDKKDQAPFWRRELKRLEKFINENAEFCQRYKSNCTEKDSEWFVRTGSPEERAAATHDQLAASLLALERYHEFIKLNLL